MPTPIGGWPAASPTSPSCSIPNTRAAKVRIELTNEAGILRPNMFATVHFVSQGTETRTVIPSTAVLRLQDRDWVFVKLNDKQFRRTEVQAGPVNPDNTQQVLSGLQRGGPGGVRRADVRSGSAEEYRTVIQKSVDFALRNRFLVLCAGILLLIWGAISFKNLPVEAYPDVANNYVQVITQWPGRAAEEVEQQVTIPIEVQMNGLPQLVSLRSWSLAGLSSINLTFDDGSNNDLNRQKVLEKLSQVNLPNGLQPTLGADYSPVGQIYFFTLKSTNPNYDVMELKSLQDWVIVKQLKSVPDVVDVSVFGGATREYQVQVDPNKLISYGLSIGQVEQALSNNNVNAGGSFIERGEQAINVRAVGLVQSTEDIGAIVLKTQNGIPVRVRDIATVQQGPKIRLGQMGKAIHDEPGKGGGRSRRGLRHRAAAQRRRRG